MGSAATEIESILAGLKIPIEELVRGGGGEAQVTQRIRRAFADRQWTKHGFVIKKSIDGNEKESTTHEVDHVKRFGSYTIALEIEWNNKDPFFDRDLDTFKRLHAEGAVSIGCIITRGRSLHEGIEQLIERFALSSGISNIDELRTRKYYDPSARQEQNIRNQTKRNGSFEKGWAAAFCADKFGESTTHWRKLDDRVRRGVGSPCPLLLIGIPAGSVIER